MLASSCKFRTGDGHSIRSVVNPALDPDPESDFQFFVDSESGIGCCKMGNHNTYGGVIINGEIFDAGFGEILRSPHLQWAGKQKFAP